MKLDCFRIYISSIFLNIGKKICKYRYYCVFISIISSSLFSLGILKIKFNRDMDYLFTADSGDVFATKQFIDRTYPMNTSFLVDELRYTKRPRALIFYIIKKDYANMLERNIFSEIKIVNNIVMNTTVTVGGKIIQYSDICGKVYNRCYENPIFYLIRNCEDVFSRKIKFKYPVDIDPLTYTYKNFALNFGGVITDDNGYVEKVKSIRLIYFVDEDDLEKVNWIKEWMKVVPKNVKLHNFKYIKPLLDPLLSIEADIEMISDNIKPFIAACILIVSIFSIITLMSNSCIRSKPWLGIASVMSAGFAVGSGFGLMGICGVKNTDWNFSIPFLILVIEVDDAYVLIACWRITNHQDNVEKRMGNTFAEAGISITITSVTSFSSYCVGMLCTFPIIRIYCMYAAVCVFFNYMYQIFFFGGCLALSGYRENQKYHTFYFSVAKHDFISTRTTEQYFFMKLLGDNVEKAISYPIGKIIIILLYIVNLFFGIWGFLSLKDGLNITKFYPDHSEISEAFRVYYKYFTEYPFPIQILINQPLDYSDHNIQKSIENFLIYLKNHPNIADSNFTISWLYYYKEFQSMPIAQYSLRGYDLSKEQDFINGLQNVFLKFKTSIQFSNDIIFNKNFSKIISSRIFLLAINISNGEIEEKLTRDLWKMKEKAPFNIIIYHMFSGFIEQKIIIRNVTIQLLWITSIFIFLVFIIFIPNVFWVIVVTSCVASTMIEVLGYMSLLKINLDMTSMMFLILSMGFCINYPLHISYTFLSHSNKNLKDRLKLSLYNICFPIFQGSLSTILGIMILLYIKIYVTITFVKMICVATLVTAFHSMFIIPVFLSLIIPYTS